MLYKLKNNRLIPFKAKHINMNGKVYANPNDTQLIKAGYKRLVEVDMPELEEGFYYVSTYEIVGDKIVQSWRKYKIEEDINNGEII